MECYYLTKGWLKKMKVILKKLMAKSNTAIGTMRDPVNVVMSL